MNKFQAFELAKAKLDVTELRNSLSQATKLAADKEELATSLQTQLEMLIEEKRQLGQQLEAVVGR